MRACFDKLVPAPKNTVFTRQDILKLVTDLKRSELRKSQCGKTLLSWYATYAAKLDRK